MALDRADTLPLFPLNTVLFPGMPLPLHIFEERYRIMIRRCLAEGLPFGVLLIREGKEVGAAAVPHDVGTTARITQVEQLDDGRLNIQTVGAQRFRLRQLLSVGAPYLRGEVELFPLTGGDAPAASAQVPAVQRLLREYGTLLAEATGSQLALEQLPDDPPTLAFLTAIALQVSHRDKQALLGIESAAGLLAAEARLLRREHQVLRYILRTGPEQRTRPMGPTGFLFPN